MNIKKKSLEPFVDFCSRHLQAAFVRVKFISGTKFKLLYLCSDPDRVLSKHDWGCRITINWNLTILEFFIKPEWSFNEGFQCIYLILIIGSLFLKISGNGYSWNFVRNRGIPEFWNSGIPLFLKKISGIAVSWNFRNKLPLAGHVWCKTQAFPTTTS